MRVITVAFVLTLGVTAAAIAGETVTITLPPESIALKAGAGLDQTQTSCRTCHSLDYITMQPGGGAGQWHGVVTKMMKVFGAPLSDQDAKAIAEYLATHYGPGR
jgi:mono/diheme cytochrome c family protein